MTSPLLCKDEATRLPQFWYPLALSGDLRRPQLRWLLDQPIALFRDDSGTPRALNARCPHRGGNLADGRLVGGALECPYHGWQFEGSGRCVSIPSQPDRPISAGCVADTYALEEVDGIVWGCLQTPVAPPPSVAHFTEGLRHFSVETVVPLPLDWWVENILDVTHVPFAHSQAYGGQDPAIESYDVSRWDDGLGFEASVTLRPFAGALTRLLHRAIKPVGMAVKVTHHMPSTTIFDVKMGRGRRQVLVFLATPEAGQRSRVWAIVGRNYWRLPGSDVIGRAVVRSVFREDIVLGQRALGLVSVDAPVVSVAADAPALEYLRLLRRWRSEIR